MEKYRKAVVAVVGAAVAVLAVVGVDVSEALSTSVVGVVTGLLVYLVPNEG